MLSFWERTKKTQIAPNKTAQIYIVQFMSIL